MSKLSSDRLNFAREGNETVALAHSYFANIPEGVRHVLIAVASWSCWSMAKRTENPADCEIRAVIRFLKANNIHPADIHRQVCEVYGEGAMSGSMVRRWCRHFESGRDNVHDDKRSGRPSVVTPDLVQQIEVKIRENRRFTIMDLAECFPNVSRKTVHRIVTENLHFRKPCARWVPKNLTPEHKTKRMGPALSFLERYENDGYEFLTHIVTGDETQVYHVTPESKQQSMQWRHTSSPSQKKKKKSRHTALAKSCARYSGTVMEFCSLITVQMDKQTMPRCTATPYNAYAGLFKTNARDYSAPQQRPSVYGSANNSPTAAISLGYHGSPPPPTRSVMLKWNSNPCWFTFCF